MFGYWYNNNKYKIKLPVTARVAKSYAAKWVYTQSKLKISEIIYDTLDFT